MHNGCHAICTGSLFFMLYLQYKVGPGKFLIGQRVGRNKKNYPLMLSHAVTVEPCIPLNNPPLGTSQIIMICLYSLFYAPGLGTGNTLNIDQLF